MVRNELTHLLEEPLEAAWREQHQDLSGLGSHVPVIPQYPSWNAHQGAGGSPGGDAVSNKLHLPLEYVEGLLLGVVNVRRWSDLRWPSLFRDRVGSAPPVSSLVTLNVAMWPPAIQKDLPSPGGT